MSDLCNETSCRLVSLAAPCVAEYIDREHGHRGRRRVHLVHHRRHLKSQEAHVLESRGTAGAAERSRDRVVQVELVVGVEAVDEVAHCVELLVNGVE